MHGEPAGVGRTGQDGVGIRGPEVSGGQVPGNLLMDAQINLFVRAENIDHGLMIDQGLDDKGGHIEADDIGMGHNGPDGGVFIVNIKIIGVAECFKAFGYLFFKVILTGGFDLLVLHEFR